MSDQNSNSLGPIYIIINTFICLCPAVDYDRLIVIIMNAAMHLVFFGYVELNNIIKLQMIIISNIIILCQLPVAPRRKPTQPTEPDLCVQEAHKTSAESSVNFLRHIA